MAKLNRSQAEYLRTQLNSEMQRHLPTWKDQAKFISPKRLRNQYTNKVDGNRRNRNILNNQAGRSLRVFQSGLMNGATPRNRPWFSLTSSNPSIRKNSNVRKYYFEVEKIIREYFDISNLYRVLPLAYGDLGTFSNSAFAMLPDANTGFYFYPFTVGTYAFACDYKNRPNMFTRDFVKNVRELVEEYANRNPLSGEIDWSNIPTNVKAYWDNKQFTQEIKLTQVIVPNNDYDPRKVTFDPLTKRYQSYTYIRESGSGGIPPQDPIGFKHTNQNGVVKGNENNIGQEFIKVGGFEYFPIIIPRWEVEAEGYYGVNGPGDIALPDVKTLQEEEKFRFEAIEKLVRPPMVGHASLRRHHSSILAGGITYVDDRGMDLGFKPAFTLNPQLSDLISSKEEIQSYIKIAFFEDLFRQISSEQKLSHVTAAEIQQRSAESLAELSPVIGQLDHDLLGPLIRNAVLILESQGRLPQKPAELEGSGLKPEYISVLAQATRQSDIRTQENFINFVANTSNLLGDPNILALANPEAQVRAYAENAMVDPNTILSEDDYADVLKASAQARAQELAQQNADREAQRAKLLSETKVGTGSALDQFASAA